MYRNKSGPNIFHNNYFQLKTNNLSSIIEPNRINKVNFLKFQPRIKITKKNLSDLSNSIIADDYNNSQNNNIYYKHYKTYTLFDNKNIKRHRMNKTSSSLDRLLTNLKNEIFEMSQSILNDKNQISNYEISDINNNEGNNFKQKFNNNKIQKSFISLKSYKALNKKSYIPFNKTINKNYTLSNSYITNDLKDEKINSLLNENDLLERKLKMSNGLLPELIEKASKYEKMYDDLKKETMKKNNQKEIDNNNDSNNNNNFHESNIGNLTNELNEIVGNDENVKKSIDSILKSTSNQNNIKNTNFQNEENGASNQIKILVIENYNFDIISEKGISYHKEILNSQCEIIELRKKINDLNEQYKNQIENLKIEKENIGKEKEQYEKNIIDLRNSLDNIKNQNITFNNENNRNELIDELNKQIEELKKENSDLLNEIGKNNQNKNLYENLKNELNNKNNEFKLKENQYKENISQLELKINKINLKQNEFKNYKISKNGNLKFLSTKTKENNEIIKQYENTLKLKEQEIKELKEKNTNLMNELKEEEEEESENEYIKVIDENDIETMKMTIDNLRELVAEKEKEIQYLKSMAESQNESLQSNNNTQEKIKKYKMELENCKLQFQAEMEQNNLLKQEIKRLTNNEN